MKSLQARLISMLSAMFLVSLVLGAILVTSALSQKTISQRYFLDNELAGSLAMAHKFQAIERGIGATLLSSAVQPAALQSKFRAMGQKGDAEVAGGKVHANALYEFTQDPDLKSQISAWNNSMDAVRSMRSGVLGGSVDKKTWIKTTTGNIRNEFLLRDVAFAPSDAREAILIYNIVTRANVATLSEYAGLERAQVGGAIGGGKPMSPTLLKRLAGFRAIVEDASRRILSLKKLASTPPPVLKAISDYETEFLGNFQKLREEVYAASANKAPYPVDGPAWIGRATKGINSALAISEVIGEFAGTASESISADAQRSLYINGGLLIFAVVVFIMIYRFLRTSVIIPLNTVIETLTDGADQIQSSSGEISSSSQSLADGATQQASSLEETSSALEEISGQTRQNADNASEAAALASATRDAAKGSASTMNEMIEAMKDINASSEEISKIIKVIEEIAFQTNLLALNAAVEAARAGEHGKGFAVVAEEVRNLAQRAATAAKDTAHLIEDAVTKASAGSALADEAGHSLDAIVERVNRVTDLVGEIASASKEQASGVDQLNAAVTQMDRVTQQNAAQAEESAAASEEMAGQAHRLNEIAGDLASIVTGDGHAPEITHATPRRQPVSKARTLPAPPPAPPVAPPQPTPAKKPVGNPDDIIPMDDDFGDF